MKIIEHGVFRIESFEFRCLNCNCHFIAESHECAYIDKDVCGRIRKAACRCPECDHVAEKEVYAYERLLF